MGKIEERFLELEGFLEELSLEAEKSKVASDMTEKYSSIISEIKLESPENYRIYINHLKETLSSDLQYFHDKVEIIRKVSSETANYLDTKILEFEKIFRVFIRDVEESRDKGDRFWIEKGEETMKTVVDLTIKVTTLKQIIELCHNLLQDTLKFFRD